MCIYLYSHYNYSGFDYQIEVNADANVITEDHYDYSVGVNADSYNLNDVTEDGSTNNNYEQRSVHFWKKLTTSLHF